MINLLMPRVTYVDWERCVTDALIEVMEITNSDAQGIVEANPFVMANSWNKGLMPEEVVHIIINK